MKDEMFKEADSLKRKDSVEKLISSLQKAAPLVPAFGGVVSAGWEGLPPSIGLSALQTS